MSVKINVQITTDHPHYPLSVAAGTLRGIANWFEQITQEHDVNPPLPISREYAAEDVIVSIQATGKMENSDED